jgi:hypothetical protein
MFFLIHIVALGLLLTLIGMVISFWTNPPVVRTLNIKKHDEEAYAFAKDFSEGKIKPLPIIESEPSITKTEWSKWGVGLLLTGTFLQLVGTVWQVVVAVFRK